MRDKEIIRDLERELKLTKRTLKIFNERLHEFKDLLCVSYFLFKDKKNIIVLKKDDEFMSKVDTYLAKLKELGIGEQ